MNTALYNDNPLANAISSTFAWALGLSVLAHLLLALIIPNFEFEPKKPAEVIEVALQEIKKPEPPPPPPEPPKPVEPVKPEVKPKPIKPMKPEPIPQVIRPSEEKAPPPSQPTPVQPEVIAVAPKTESAPPSFTAPAPVVEAQPEPPKQPQPSDEDIENAKNRYGSALTREIAKHKQYPKIAQMRGWQGEVLLTLHLDSNGKVVKSEIANSSGFEALDNKALEMVKKSSFPAPPDALKGRSFEITVPVTFKLE